MGNQYTGSISKGDLTPNHNRRQDRDGNPLTPENCPDNIDLTKTPDNVVIIDRHLPELYRETFGAALEQYNASQVAKGHAERQIPDYYDHVMHSKLTNVAYEYVIQVGNMDEHPDKEVAEEIYKEWLKDIQERYKGNFVVAQAIIHVDETTSHLHLEIIPTAKSERGLPLQNSLNKALEQAGYERTKEVPRPYNAMLGDWDRMLTERMREHGIERVAGDKERQFGGVPIRAVRAASAYQEARKIEADKLVQDAKQESKAWEQVAEVAKQQTAEQQQQTRAAQVQLAQANIAAKQAEQQAQQAKGELAQAQQATEVAKGELGQVQQETAQTQDRLECLRRDEGEQRAAIAELDRAISIKEQELAAPAVDAGDDRQETGQEQQAQQERAAGEQGRSIGEQVASLGREAATAAQRAGRGEDADPRGLEELRAARDAAQQRVAELESKRDAAQGRVGELEAVQERRQQECREAESQEQKAGERLRSAESRIGELRERVVERVSQLREQLGQERAVEIVKDVRDRIGQGREMFRALLTDKVANRVNEALGWVRQQEPQQEQQQEYSARDWARYEQDRGMER